MILGLLVVAQAGLLVWLLRSTDGGDPGAPGLHGEAAPEAPDPAVDPADGEGEAEEPEPALTLEAASFEELPGWGNDPLDGALAALRASCGVWERGDGGQAVELGRRPVATRAAWRGPCAALGALPREASGEALRTVLEERFRPWRVTDRGDPQGLFTGYYEPTLEGSRRRHGPYTVPLYGRPPDLVEVDLGRFRDDLTGRRIAGRIEEGRLIPYPDRRAIDEGALDRAPWGGGLPVVWVDDPVDAFFLHIQGSGRVELDDGGVLRLGYAAQNGHPYVAIGRTLVDWEELAPEEVSMQSIRRWLEDHPERAGELLAANPSFVFFRRLQGPGPLGSQGVPLTPERSLAVDRTFHPLGAALWLDTHRPALAGEGGAASGGEAGASSATETGPPEGSVPFRRLLVAQDTGGAIRGPVRGDVFWGPGEEAAEIAGRMAHQGRMWILLPRAVEPPVELLAGLASSEPEG